MGMFDWLFGKPEKMEKTTTLSPEQQGISSALASYLQQLVSGGTKTYGGPTVAGVSPYEKAGLGILDKYLSGVGDTTTEGLDVYGQALRGMSPKQVQEEYMKYTAPGEMRYLKDVLIPTFKESQVPGGTLRSTGTERGIGDIISRFGERQMGRIGERIGEERERTIQALSMLPVMSALAGGVPQMQAAFGYGALPRQLEQDELNVQLDEFRRANPEMADILNLAQQYLGTTTMATYKTGGDSGVLGALSPLLKIPGVGSGLGTLLSTAGSTAISGIGTVLSGLLGMFSDKDLKDDIKPTKSSLEDVKKMNVVDFKYKGSSDPHVGLIAQELEKIVPSAVKKAAGYRYIDYRETVPVLVRAIQELSERSKN